MRLYRTSRVRDYVGHGVSGSLLIKQETSGNPFAQSLTGVGREILWGEIAG